MTQQNEITEETTLQEVMSYPGAVEILQKYRLPCLFCPMAAMEIGELKIGEVARAYGIDSKALIEDLNKKISGR
ncbi:MAG: hypothetical protein QW179_01695 [Candidatus Hadarchaeales archaeon]